MLLSEDEHEIVYELAVDGLILQELPDQFLEAGHFGLVGLLDQFYQICRLDFRLYILIDV